MQNIVYIGIGSNLGDKLGNCNAAIEKISKLKSTEILATSKWHNSKALTITDEKQPDYINGALKIRTSLNPEKLFTELMQIERSMGRESPRRKWAPRTIDLDILLFNDVVIDTDSLKIPHPEMHKRTFVLKPLCDIEPALRHPILKLSIKELLES